MIFQGMTDVIFTVRSGEVFPSLKVHLISLHPVDTKDAVTLDGSGVRMVGVC